MFSVSVYFFDEFYYFLKRAEHDPIRVDYTIYTIKSRH